MPATALLLPYLGFFLFALLFVVEPHHLYLLPFHLFHPLDLVLCLLPTVVMPLLLTLAAAIGLGLPGWGVITAALGPVMAALVVIASFVSIRVFIVLALLIPVIGLRFSRAGR